MMILVVYVVGNYGVTFHQYAKLLECNLKEYLKPIIVNKIYNII